MGHQLDMPWRPPYEIYSTGAWAGSLALMYYKTMQEGISLFPFYALGVIGTGISLKSAYKAYGILSARMAIAGIGIDFMTIDDLYEKIKDNEKKADKDKRVWIGYGFDWKQAQTQRLYQLKKVEPSDFYPPVWFMELMQSFTGRKIAALDPDTIGAPWVHGLANRERDLDTLLTNLIGNTLIVGINRCGKTRLLDVLLAQFIFRKKAAVIVIDPKGDAELKANMIRAAKAAGRMADFCEFDLAHTSTSIKLDPLKNYLHVQELSTRSSELMPSSGDSSGDAFKSYAWAVSNAVYMGLTLLNEKHTLKKLYNYVIGGIDALLLECLPVYFASEPRVKDHEKKIQEYTHKAIKRVDGTPVRAEPNDKERLMGLVNMYMERYKRDYPSEAIDALYNVYKHDVGHHEKMVTNFIPELAKLCTGELGELLSPDVSDINDTRLSTDLASLADRGAIVYIGLNSLADKAVASAVGSILLADMAAYAAMRYNTRTKDYNEAHPVYLTVDEVSEVANEPYIQLLNKGGGAGFVNTSAAQTIADFTARLGEEARARVTLGNFNNLFALRTKDIGTQEFVTESFGESFINTIQTTKGTNSSTEKNISHFGGTISERMSEGLEEKVPTDVLGILPNWQYIASIAGGRVIKGRLPILVETIQ